MEFPSILLIALSLSADAFAVAVSKGLAAKKLRVRDALKVGLFFGAFQAVMPVLGWFLGGSVRDLISGFDHWIAFLLLLYVGQKMMRESLTKEERKSSESLSLSVMLLLSVATSIDAFAVGLSLSFLRTPIMYPAILIGAVTFTVSTAGFIIGRKTGHLIDKKTELAGGIILILIGLKILAEHLL
ncbi:manganese efflux pump MntP [uncultured archaeon]|nr:manganese efflux pump MntP [uncultured archaeon]